MAGMKRRTDFFEVSVTPPWKRSREKAIEPEPPTVLSLAPFASVPKVCFNKIKVNTTAAASVSLHNPSDLLVELGLEVSKELKDLLELSSVEFSIPPSSTDTLLIQWSPKEELQSRGKIIPTHLNGNRKFSYISVSCSSEMVKSKKGNRRKPPAVSRAIQGNCPTKPASELATSSSCLTPNRRQTYDLPKPSFSFCPPTPIEIESQVPPLEVSFNVSPLIYPTKKAATRQNLFQSSRSPLKECNFITRPASQARLTFTPPSELRLQQRNPLDSLLELSEMNFERDSLESGEPVYVFNSRREIENEVIPRDSLDSPPDNSTTFRLLPSQPQTSFQCTEQNYDILRETSLSRKVNEAELREDVFLEFPSALNASSPKAPKVGETIGRLNKTYTKNDTIFGETSSLFKTPRCRREGIENSASASKFVTGPISFNVTPGKPVRKVPPTNLKTMSDKKVNVNKSEVMSEPDSSLVFPSMKGKLFEIPKLDPYGVTTISNPFSRRACYPREFLEKLELELLKWSNSLLVPPVQMDSFLEGVDVKKLWELASASALVVAPSRESASKDFILADGGQLTALRKRAVSIMESQLVKDTILAIRSKIDSGFISVKDGIWLCRNQGARFNIVQLCMYYNPLWLRLALEAIYQECIPVQKESIHRGLVYFLKSRLLATSPRTLDPTNLENINNQVVLKFMTLIFFLDRAKLLKIIPYDPCLFCKNSPIKTSEGILNEFVKEFLKCTGQFKKTLKAIGFDLKFCQSALDEYDYGLRSHLDLRDGVRLTRILEVILKDPTYSSALLAPVISRVQKIHNVKVAFTAITRSGCSIPHEISENDIVDGHKEKIFSLLWQILHELLGPRYQSSARTIQYWWRKIYLKRTLMRNIALRAKENKCAIKIQTSVRGFLVRRRYQKMKMSAVLIQRWFRNSKLVLADRFMFLGKKRAALKIQSWFRSISLQKRDRQKYLLMKESAIKIQKMYRNYRLLKFCKNNYLMKKQAVRVIQKWFRNTRHIQERSYFVQLRSQTLFIQRKFRARRLACANRASYLLVKTSAVTIQTWYRAVSHARKDRSRFVLMKASAITIQRWYRGMMQTRIERNNFIELRSATIKIQSWFKNVRPLRRNFLEMRESALLIQRWYRQAVLCKNDRDSYLKMKLSAITLQRWYRGTAQTKIDRNNFIELRSATIKIQTWFKYVRPLRRNFLQMRKSALLIQRWYRQAVIFKNDRENYLCMKKSALTIQHWYRGMVQTRIDRYNFIELRSATIKIQTWFKYVRPLRRNFLQMRHSALLIQRWYRRAVIFKNDRENYLCMKKSALTIQRWYRGMVQTRIDRYKFIELRSATIKIQTWFKYVRPLRRNFLLMRHSALLIQRWYRQAVIFKNDRENYLSLKKSALTIQRWYRGMVQTRIERNNFIALRCAAIKVQTWFKFVKPLRRNFLQMRQSALLIQRWYRQGILYKNDRDSYLRMKMSAITVQRWYRGTVQTKIERNRFIELRSATIKIQIWFKYVRPLRRSFLQMRKSALLIQRWYRQAVIFKKDRDNYLSIKKSALTIQRCYRGMVQTRIDRYNFIELRSATIKIQTWFKYVRTLRRRFLQMRESALLIQRWYRQAVLFKNDRENYIQLRTSAITIQRWYRLARPARRDRRKFILMKESATTIQRWYRELITARRERRARILYKSATIIQTSWRGFIVRRKWGAIVRKLREKVKKTTSETLTLKELLQKALGSVINVRKRSLDDLASSYHDIDVCIKYSPVLCVELSKNDLFWQFLMYDLNQSMRGGLILTIYRSGLGIILKLVKYPETVNTVINSLKTNDGFNIIVSLMGKYVDKNTDIYCKGATILWLLFKSPATRKLINWNLPLDKIAFHHKKISSKTAPLRGKEREEEKFIPSDQVEWGYFDKSEEFLNIKTASSQLMNLQKFSKK